MNPYLEEDIPNANDTYGISKMLGENINGTVIRTTLVGESKTNKNCLIEWLKSNKNKTIRGFIRDYWNGVTCLTIAEEVAKIIAQNLYWSGVRHIISDNMISKYELCKYINHVYELNLTINPHAHVYRNIILKSKYNQLTITDSLLTQIHKQKIFTLMNSKTNGTYINKIDCRFCNTKTNDILHLGNKYGLAGGFLESLDKLSEDKVYPLSLVICPRCKYIQCKQIVSSDELFKKNYYYYSSMIGTLVKHFNDFAEIIYTRYPNKNTKIIEIGCNDGVLLHPLKKLGYNNIIGIDPSRTILNIDKSIQTYNEYFNDNITETILQKHGKFDIFISCNSFAHIDDMNTIMKNIKKILNPNGIALIEVHYSKHIFNDKHFDFIYHEHMGYYTCTSLYHICKLYDMHLINVEYVPMHGGSLRCTIHMQPTKELPCIQNYIKDEAYLFEPKYMISYTKQLYDWKEEFKKVIFKLQENHHIYGYGASGRANTLMNFCEILLNGIVDDAASKIGTYTPLFNILIEDSKVLYSDNPPKYVVILAWPYSEAIIEKHKLYLQNGGTFIIPLPQIKQITS